MVDGMAGYLMNAKSDGKSHWQTYDFSTGQQWRHLGGWKHRRVQDNSSMRNLF
jgi:hypothetical protein